MGHAGSAGPARMLLVEDEFLIRLTLVEALADEGFEVIEAETAEEALRLIRSDGSLRLLMTDVQLPGKVDGVALAETVRSLRPGLPIIFMTGRPESLGDHARGERDAYIAKPYLPSEVAATIRRLLG